VVLCNLSSDTTICITRTTVGTTYTIVGITYTTIGTLDGFTLPFIIFFALTSMLSYSLFTHEHEAPPSSTLLFILRTLIGECATTFFLFSNVVYISSLVLLTLAGVYPDSPFDA
jgi:hypothetical protein